MKRPRATTVRTEGWALAGLLGFTLITIGGFWTFGLHPERIPSTPLAGRFYAISFAFFGQIHILAAFATLAFVLTRRTGARWLLSLAVICAVSWVSEHLGTGYGVPFGRYAYTDLLGAKFGARVPLLIPLSWFYMAVPAWAMARWAFPLPKRSLVRPVVGALWMVVWDLSLDPAMSFLTPYWRWDQAGAFYGMPLVNLAGWAATSLVLMVSLEALPRGTGLSDVPVSWLASFYVTVLLLPLGMVAAAGLWPAVLATLAGVTILSGWSMGARKTSLRTASAIASGHSTPRTRPAWTS